MTCDEQLDLRVAEVRDDVQILAERTQEDVHDAGRPLLGRLRGRKHGTDGHGGRFLVRPAAGECKGEAEKRDERTLHHLDETSSRRKRSRRPRTLASTRSEPASRTTPPIRSGSTVRVASTLRPEASAICFTISAASSSESSWAVVSSTFR